MTPAQQSAVRVCGVATLVTIIASAIDMFRVASNDRIGSGLSLTLGASVLVAAIAFLLANTTRRSVALAICNCAPIVVLGLALIATYKFLARTTVPYSPPVEVSGPLDFIVAGCVFILLIDLCRSTKSAIAEQRV